MTISALSRKLVAFGMSLANQLPDQTRDQARQTKQALDQRRKDQARGRFGDDAAYFNHLVTVATQTNPVATATQTSPEASP